MAYVPCDRHGEPFRGKSCGFYPTLETWDTKYSRKLKVCPDCSRDLVIAHAVDWADQLLRNAELDRHTCTACGVVLAGEKVTNAFWATLYVDGKQRRDYAARYCEACTRERIQEFHLDAG